MPQDHDQNQAGSEGQPHLRRVLGPVDATCVVVGAIIGVGIFFNPSQVAANAGSGNIAMLAWATGGFIALMGALTFAELGGLYPKTGGQYFILKDAFGPMTGFLYVFCNATAIQAGALAIIATVSAQYLGIAVGVELNSGPRLILVATMLIVGLTFANVLGVRWGSRIQNLTVYAKVLTLLAVSGLALFAGDSTMTPTIIPEPGVIPGSNPGVGPGVVEAEPTFFGTIALIFAALVPAFFAFGGWQQGLWVAGEVRRPRRNVPLAIVGGVMLVASVYLLVNWAYLKLLGFEGVMNSDSIASDAVATIWPGWGERIIALMVALSAFGVLNAQLLAGPRLINGLARDGRFFRIFAVVHARFQTPMAAIILLGSLALGLMLLAGNNVLDKLLTGVVFIDGVFFALTGIALLVLRRKRPEADRPVRVPLYPIVPLLFVLGEFGILIGAFYYQRNLTVVLSAMGWIVGAAVFYFVFFRKANPIREAQGCDEAG